MRKLLFLVPLIVGIAGCASEEPAAAVVAPPTTGGGAPRVGDTVNGTKIVNRPPDSIPAGGIMLQPSDPNDPKFKPDPKLNGGG